MDAVQASIVAQGGYDWQNFRSVRTPQKAACAAFLREACSNGSQVQSSAMQFWLSYEFNANKSGVNLTSFAMDLGVFLAARGPYAWLGHGWKGCSQNYPFPQEFNLDYGEPVGGQVCAETGSGTGVFEREYTKASVRMDCNSWTPTITMK